MNSLKAKRNGFTLIEILIGLVISLIVIATMLMIFKSQTKIAYGKNGLVQTSKAYSQVTSALTIIGLKVQSAGFGITPALNTNIQLYTNAVMVNGVISNASKLTIGPVSSTGNLVIWTEDDKFNGADNFQCKGFYSNQVTGGVLYINQSNCQVINTGGAWSVSQIVNDNVIGSALTFEMFTQASCSPFGLLSTSGVTNSGVTFKLHSTLNGTSNVQGYCLLNY